MYTHTYIHTYTYTYVYIYIPIPLRLHLLQRVARVTSTRALENALEDVVLALKLLKLLTDALSLAEFLLAPKKKLSEFVLLHQ